MSVQLPSFGMGCSALGNLYRPMSDGDAAATVAAALAAGVRYFDVAPHYGFGMAERRLGAALKLADRSTVILSTKVGRILSPTQMAGARHGFVDADPFEPVFDYTFEGVLASYRSSLERLGTTRVELLLAHDLGKLTHGEAAEEYTQQFLKGGYRALCQLKVEGRIDLIGIGVNEIDICHRLLDDIALDVILLAGRYTLLEQDALPLLDRCAQLGVRVIVGGPFNSGLLVENPDSGSLHYDYGKAPARLVSRVASLRSICAEYSTPLPAAALRFPLGHPAVACVLPGFAGPAQVEQAVAWNETSIPAAFWPALKDAQLLAPGAPYPVGS